jgi:phage I-like protein
MTRSIASIHAAFAPEADAPPEWLHLLPAGEFRGQDGRGPYRLRDAARVIAASRLPLVVDENHATDLAAPEGRAAPARGWIVELQARADGIWGRVDWTPPGRQLLAERAYRGISPVFVHAKKTGEVTALLRAGLTNAPNLPQLATLHHEDPDTMDLLAELRALHGLPADADAAAAIEACRAAHQAITAHAAALDAIAAAAGLPPGQEAAALATALQAQRRDAGEAGRMREELLALQAQLAALKQQAARERAERFLDEAMKAGKPIPRALREHYVARHMQDAAAVEKEIGAMVSLHAGGLSAAPGEEPGIDPGAIARQAQALQDSETRAGRSISTAEAVSRVLAALKKA